MINNWLSTFGRPLGEVNYYPDGEGQLLLACLGKGGGTKRAYKRSLSDAALKSLTFSSDHPRQAVFPQHGEVPVSQIRGQPTDWSILCTDPINELRLRADTMCNTLNVNKEPSSRIVPQYASYVEFINECASVSSEYTWLQHFLAYPSPAISETQVTIFDAVEGKLLESGPFSSPTSDFDQVLMSGPGQGLLRFIIVTYNQVWSVDRGIVDKLGLHFDVDPSFFRRHFYYYFQYTESVERNSASKYEEDKISQQVFSLPSEMAECEYHFSLTREYDKMSMLLCRDPTNDTVNILCLIRCHKSTTQAFGSEEHTISRSPRPSVFTPVGQILRPLHASLSTHYVTYLRQLSEEEVIFGIRDPLRLCLPYTRNLLLLFYREHTNSWDSEQIDHFDNAPDVHEDASQFEEKLYQLQFELAALNTLYGELSRLHRGLKTPEARCLLDVQLTDLTWVRGKFEKSSSHFKTAKQGALMAAQMTEAKESTALAVAVNRLSKLAFVFLPLSFSTSIFGMNLRQFGQGTVLISTFLVTAVLVAVISFLPLMPAIWQALRIRGMWEKSLTVFNLLCFHPIGVPQYLGLLIVFDHDIVQALCGKRLQEAFHVEEHSEEETLPREAVERRMRDSNLSSTSIRAWKRRAEDLVYFADRRIELSANRC